MDKYLLEILKEVNTIIIPGLGALTITNKDTGEIMFMDYLKHDDGQLAEYIAQKEGIEVNEAKNMIAKYVREISSTLDKGESYDMFKFGTFIKNGDDIEFTNWGKGDTSTPKEEPKKPVKKVEDKPAKKEAAPKKATAKKKTTAKKKEEPKEKPVAKKATPKKTAAKKEADPVKEVSKKAEAAKPAEKKPEVKEVKKEIPAEKAATPKVPISKAEEKEMNIAEKEELDANVKKLDALKAKKEEKPKKKRGVGFYVLIIIAVLLIGGGTTTFIFYDDVKGYIPFLADNDTDQTKEEAIDEAIEDQEANEEELEAVTEEMESETMEEEVISPSEEESSVVEEEIISEPEEEIVEKVAPPMISEPVQSGFLPYHVVLGSFAEETNAQRFAAKLQAEGYSNAKIMYGSGLHMVSAKAFATREEAEQSKASIGSGWILEWH